MHSSRRQFFLSAVGLATTAKLDRVSDPLHFSSVQEVTHGGVHYSTVYRQASSSGRDVSLAKLMNGDVVAAFQQCKEGHHTGSILLTRSKDNGIRWDPSQLQTIFGDGEAQPGYGAAMITQLSAGTVLSCSAKFQFLLERGLDWKRGSEIEGLYLRKSTDSGYSWSPTSKVDITPFQVAWPRGSILELPDGRLLLPLCGQKEDRYKRTTEPISSFLLRSDDGGASWGLHSVVASDSGARDYENPCIIRLLDGRLLVMMKSHCARSRSPHDGYVYQTISEDGGLSWQAPVQTRIWGDLGDLTSLDDGRVLCTFSYPIHPRPGIRRCISNDGTSWRSEDIVEVKSVPAPSPAEIDSGCPRSVQLKDGSILSVYQTANESGCQNPSHLESGPRRYLESARYRV